jgi:hypothetical protein
MSQCAEVSENERELRASMQTQLTQLKVHTCSSDVILHDTIPHHDLPSGPHTHTHRKNKINRYRRSTSNWHHSKISESIGVAWRRYNSYTHAHW